MLQTHVSVVRCTLHVLATVRTSPYSEKCAFSSAESSASGGSPLTCVSPREYTVGHCDERYTPLAELRSGCCADTNAGRALPHSGQCRCAHSQWQLSVACLT